MIDMLCQKQSCKKSRNTEYRVIFIRGRTTLFIPINYYSNVLIFYFF